MREELISGIVDVFASTHKLLQVQYQLMFADQALSPSQLQLLFKLESSPNVSHKEIANQMYLTPGAVTQLVEPLEAHKYVERTADEHDRRSVRLRLSNSGQHKVDKLKVNRRQLFEKVLQTLSDTELEIMLNAQQKMLRALQLLAHKDITSSKLNRKET